MRSMRPVSAEEFSAFIADKSLEQKRVGNLQCYLEPGTWPDNLVASFVPAGSRRGRDGGWRIAVDEAAPNTGD